MTHDREEPLRSGQGGREIGEHRVRFGAEQDAAARAVRLWGEGRDPLVRPFGEPAVSLVERHDQPDASVVGDELAATEKRAQDDLDLAGIRCVA